MEDETTAKIANAITDSQTQNGQRITVVVSHDDLQYAVSVIQARATGQLGKLFWGGKTGSSWTITIESSD